ncbi:MAG TPA: M3 family oligoendopeptidase [Nitrospiraceae bacterium]|nr:M3 family oligoendopeptidase [Nitrospiraceae bacterium]
MATAPVSRTRTTSRTSPPYGDQWNLSDLFPQGEQDVGRSLRRLEELVAQFESFRATLSPDLSTASFRNVLDLSEQIATISTTIGAHAYLWYSENTKDAKARSHKAAVEQRLAALQNRLLFFDLWWQGLDETNAHRLREAAGDLRYHLDTIRRFSPHTLSEREEQVINLKNTTGRTALTTLYEIVTNGFSFTLTVKGKRRTLNREQLSAFVRSPHARLREAAYRELYRVFETQRDLLGETYKMLVNDWKTEQLDLRKFAAPLSVRNLQNDVPDQAVTALLSVCTKNAPVFQRYFKLKARLCGLPRMIRYHIYAPVRTTEKRFRYQDAVRLVLEAYRSFSPHLADLAEQVFKERHVHARTQPGKMGGAYCYSIVPGMTPYVLLNFTGEAREIATMAHELGHAVHGMMAAKHSVFTFHSTLPLAETASVFGERILSDALLQQERNQQVKQGLLMAQLDDAYATIMRQAYFVQFERSAHDLIAQGATVQEVAAEYLRLLREQLGTAVPVPKEFRWEWLTIPHIYASPFYCYAYSFGNLLVLALYRMYKQEGQAFVPRYLNLLATGGSQSPDQILRSVGVDMSSEAFWQSGFDTLKEMVTDLEKTIS